MALPPKCETHGKEGRSAASGASRDGCSSWLVGSPEVVTEVVALVAALRQFSDNGFALVLDGYKINYELRVASVY